MDVTTNYFTSVTREDHLADALSAFAGTLETKTDRELMALMGTLDADLSVALRDGSALGLYRLEVVQGKIEILGEAIDGRLA